MTSHLKTLTALALVSVLLTACGGGGGGGEGSFSSNSAAAAVPDADPSTEPGVLTVTDATIPSLNGVYGRGELTATEVYYQTSFGTQPELCAFRFTGAEKVGAATTASLPTTGTAVTTASTTTITSGFVQTSTNAGGSATGTAAAAVVPTNASTGGAFGKITYRPSAMGLYFAFLTFDGKEYSSGDSVDTMVDRTGNLVRFTSKTMTATDGSNQTLKLTAIIPMNTVRNQHC